ncbi:type I restriction enzyme, S subunit [Trujillonella endophytica]|uniref:Type I restriction enzyme, S subunit n=2 Tax=Trujillonella endophytica TaxID=673521 RepID=A0A1H8R1I0_9ACTN|nr:type I restriction enzyme, S subunit [Trujillella endophytica]
MATNQGFKSLIPEAEVLDAKYLYHWLCSKKAYLQSLGNGATFKEISKTTVARVEIPVPSIEEQRRIATVLDQADVVRARRRQSIGQLDDLPRAIFLEMFGGMTERLRFVAEVGSQEKGSIRTGPFGSQLLHSEFVDEGVAVLGIDNVVTNRFRWHGRRYVTPEKYQKLKRYTVVPGDVLITIMGTCGRCVVVPEDIPTAINTKHICAITVDRAQVLPEFLRGCFLWHPVSRRFLLQRAKGSIMDGLNMGIIKEMPMPVPPLGLQAEFVRRAHVSARAFEVATRSEREIEELFSAIQSHAFAGQL